MYSNKKIFNANLLKLVFNFVIIRCIKKESEIMQKRTNPFATPLKSEPVAKKPEIVEKAVQNLTNEVPNINIVYYHDGYFNSNEEILNELKLRNAKLILVALGSPKQEKFINEAKSILKDGLMIGVGGSFDVWSGMVQRAPKIYQKLGLEWLYRTIKQPERFKRIFPALPLFVLKVLDYKFRGDKSC